MHIDLAGILRPGDGVMWGQACAEPQTLVEAFVAQRAAYPGASAFLGINYAGIVRPEHADHLRLQSYCGAGHNRALADAGVLEIQPAPYSRLADLIRARVIRADVVMLQVSPPNARGEYSMGLAADYLVPALACCRAIVAEINDQVPWIHTERLLRQEDLAFSIRTSRPPAPAPKSAPGDTERAIAKHAAAFIPEGATLEFGLGALPDAVCAELVGRRELAVHSGAIGDGVADLLESGSAGSAVGGVLMGSSRLFGFARENPVIRLASTEYTHDARVMSRIERFTAINSAVEVDLTGQLNGEVANRSYVGAVGGALDFVRAANQSPGGVALTILPSAVGTKASRIVPVLSGPVATPRSEAGVIVTEHGAADLRGCTLRERARRMAAIAHPAFREQLEHEARRMKW
ncbi:MAG: acetyl-CoA hydrolase/transferase family protein [Burkholderiales bacterium]